MVSTFWSRTRLRNPLPVGIIVQFLPGPKRNDPISLARLNRCKSSSLSTGYCANNFAHKLKIAWIQRLDRPRVDSHFSSKMRSAGVP